jgi:hypothetical protein
MPGAIYGKGYKQLQSHCFAYVHATEVGGTHPALIEAMGRGAMVLYLSTPENDEVAGDAGIPFDPDMLVSTMQWAANASQTERTQWGCRAKKRVQDLYSWDAVTDVYERLFLGMAGKSAAHGQVVIP